MARLRLISFGDSSHDSPTTVCFFARGGIDGFSRAFPGVFAARLTVCSYDPRKKSREGVFAPRRANWRIASRVFAV
jgi:hypothetical protein